METVAFSFDELMDNGVVFRPVRFANGGWNTWEIPYVTQGMLCDILRRLGYTVSVGEAGRVEFESDWTSADTIEPGEDGLYSMEGWACWPITAEEIADYGYNVI